MEITIFNKKEVGRLRAALIDNEPYFSAEDLSHILMCEPDYNRIMFRYVDYDDQKDATVDGVTTTMVNTSGVYTFVYCADADHDVIAAFKQWFAKEVLPTMRGKANGISFTDMLSKPEFITAVLTKLKEEIVSKKTTVNENTEKDSFKTKARKKRLSEMLDKMDSDELLSVTEIAREYGKPAKWLNLILEDLGVQYREEGSWVIDQEHAGSGYTRTVPITYGGRKTPKHTVQHMYWTYSGKYFIYNLLKTHGIVPLDEEDD